GGMATDRSRRDRGIGAYCELVAQQLIHAFAVHHQHHQVDLFETQLQAKAPTLDGYEGWSRPVGLASAAKHDAFAIGAAQAEAAFGYAGHYSHARGLIEQVLRNPLVRRGHYLAEDRVGPCDPIVLALFACAQSGRWDKRQEQEEC